MTASAIYPDLKGRVVYISGGATGIGLDLVQGFAEQESKVVFCDINVEAGEELAASLGDHVTFLECDVTDLDALAGVLEHAEDLGGLDVVVNNAGNDLRIPIEDVDADAFVRTVDINLKHQFFAAKFASKFMIPRKRGSIINFGSVAPEVMVPNLAVYSACKSGARGLTRSLAKDLGQHNIRANSIMPGAIMTPKQREIWYPTQADIDRMTAMQALPRELDGRDIANMALFLASDVSSGCTGQDFIVDAGIC